MGHGVSILLVSLIWDLFLGQHQLFYKEKFPRKIMLNTRVAYFFAVNLGHFGHWTEESVLELCSCPRFIYIKITIFILQPRTVSKPFWGHKKLAQSKLDPFFSKPPWWCWLYHPLLFYDDDDRPGRFRNGEKCWRCDEMVLPLSAMYPFQN